MIVSELIAALQKMDQTLPVIFTDYQFGEQLIDGVSEIEVEAVSIEYQDKVKKLVQLTSEFGAI